MTRRNQGGRRAGVQKRRGADRLAVYRIAWLRLCLTRSALRTLFASNVPLEHRMTANAGFRRHAVERSLLRHGGCTARLWSLRRPFDLLPNRNFNGSA